MLKLVLDRKPVAENELFIVGDRPVHEIVNEVTSEYLTTLVDSTEEHTVCTFSKLVLDLYVSFMMERTGWDTNQATANVFVHDSTTDTDIPFLGVVHQVVDAEKMG